MPAQRLASPYVLVLLVILLYTLLHDIGKVPVGVFADEQLIGLSAKDVIEDRGEFGRFRLFFDHFETVAGTLPVYSTVPVVALFGLSDWSLRLASVLWSFGTGFVLWRTFVFMRFPMAWLPPLVFLLSPLMIHLSRVSFGHTCSLFFIALGIYLYMRGQHSAFRLVWCIVAGVAVAVAAYGYPGFYVAVPLYILAVSLSELFRGVRDRHSLTGLLGFVVGAVAGYLPVIREARTNPEFMNRLDAKRSTDVDILSWDWFSTALQSYPKYFHADFLFAHGETGQEGVRILRHSVEGAGLLPWFVLPLIVLGVLTPYLTRTRRLSRTVTPFVILLVLYPVPDLLTTDVYDAPYTFSAATTALVVPFLVAGGIFSLCWMSHAIQEWWGSDPKMERVLRLVGPGMVALLLVGTSLIFTFSTYARYPLRSSGYWGWQSGPEEIAAYWIAHEDEYDQLIMQGVFNEPWTQLDFYIQDPALRVRAQVGSVEWRSSRVTQLFAVTPERYQEAWTSDHWMVAHVVYYPDDSVAFYMMTRHPRIVDTRGQPQLLP